MQSLVRLFDRLHSDRQRSEEALVRIVIAEKPATG
jgi:hypothetical protein